VDEVLVAVPEIRRLVERGIIDPEELHYPPFNNTTEVIP